MLLKRRTHAQSSPVGYVDWISRGVIHGWAWNPTTPRQRLTVDVFVDKCFMGQFLADVYRPDLQSAGIGDGHHGFIAYISDPRLFSITLERVSVYTSFPKRTKLNHPGAAFPVAPASGSEKKMRYAEGLHHFFAGLVEQVTRDPQSFVPNDNSEATSRQRPSLVDKLVAPSFVTPKLSHRHHLTAYADHIRYKYGMDKIYDVSAGASDIDKYLKWYLELHAPGGHLKSAPLSSEDVAYLNEPIRIDGLVSNISRVAAFFSPDHVDEVTHASPSAVEVNRFIYWWVVEESRKLSVDDCLVTRDQVLALQELLPGAAYDDFPLSIFMEIFISKNEILHDIDLTSVECRKFVYFAIALYSLRLPHLLGFVPQKWLSEILEGGSLRDFIASEFRSSNHLTIVAVIQKLCQTERAKYSALNDPRPRVRSLTLAKPFGELCDVQIIGPFHRTLGLGESARRLAKLIGTLNYKLNLCNFDLENASPKGSFDDLRLGQVSRARVNVLHLNPETLPAAIAYLPDIFTNAFNIGFCYWELPTPAYCQLLGLSLPDEIWTASNFVAKAFRTHCKLAINVGMPYDVDANADRPRGRRFYETYNIRNSDFVFLHISDALSWAQRKNPLGAIEAFNEAFRGNEGIKLVIKTHNAHMVSGDHEAVWRAVSNIAADDQRIVFIDKTLPRSEMNDLLVASDCVVSPHRSEGFGLDLLQAMHWGIPVIATNYSGNVDFCKEDTAWLLPYDKCYLAPFDYAFVKDGDTWANPHTEAAVAAMRDVYFNEQKRRDRIENARRYVELFFSPEAVLRQIDARLTTILSGQPNKRN